MNSFNSPSWQSNTTNLNPKTDRLFIHSINHAEAVVLARAEKNAIEFSTGKIIIFYFL
jgi:hypothetical protein